LPATILAIGTKKIKKKDSRENTPPSQEKKQ